MITATLSNTYGFGPLPTMNLQKQNPSIDCVLVSQNTVQQALWQRMGKKWGANVHTFSNVGEFFNSGLSNRNEVPVFLEIEFGEYYSDHPEHVLLHAHGFTNVFPVPEHCVPSEALRFASSLFKWQNSSID